MSNFIRKTIYEKQPYIFVSLDKMNERSANSVYWNKNHSFHIADVTDAHTLNMIFKFEHPDIVIHGAAESESSPTFIDSNIQGTINVLNACIEHKVDKFIYISTDEVYAQNKNPVNESAVLDPQNKYAISKMTSELFTRSMSAENNLNYNIVRLSNSYGPRQNLQYLIPTVIKNVINNTKFTWDANPQSTKDWTHVFDHVSGILTVLTNGINNKVYNISSNQELTAPEVAQKICNTIGTGHDLVTIKSSKPNFDLVMDSSAIRNIGWEPKYKFKDGITEVVQWFMTNQWALR